MRAIAEFRVDEQFAPMLFAEHEGKRLGAFVRKVELQTTDPRYKRVGELQKKLRQSAGKPFYYGWSLTYKYSSREINAASLLRLKITSGFEPAGEECGTKYDESMACPRCGAGAKQTTPLFLDVTRIPKGKDVSRTIAGEIVVTRRVMELLARHGITGAELSPIRPSRSSSAESNDWFQLAVPNATAEIIAPTRVGIDPFYADETCASGCVLGDLLGLNLLSEVTIEAATLCNTDFACSRQFIGARQGLLRPERVILISPKVANLIGSEKIRGGEIEVARCV